MGRPREVRVRVPASSANLGPGFDTLGLALSCYDDVEVTASDRPGITVEMAGEGAGRVRCDDSHLVVRAMQAAFAVVGDAPAGLALRCTNAIPQSRGMGSSAAAIVAGAVAAVVLAGRDVELERDTLLQVTAGMEGHADNAAASLLGGFVVAWESRGNTGVRYDAVRLDVHPDIRPVVFVPGTESLTATTRGLLPAAVPFADAAFTGSRSALSVLAFTQRPELLLAATEDRLHQPYRRSAYPESAALVAALRAQGVPAAVSGAGPSVLALTSDGLVPTGVDAVIDEGGFTAVSTPVDGLGARIDVG